VAPPVGTAAQHKGERGARPAPWPDDFQGLLVRHDRHHEIHEAFLAIACCLVLAAELIVIRVL
jgi:hypothetical protein